MEAETSASLIVRCLMWIFALAGLEHAAGCEQVMQHKLAGFAFKDGHIILVEL